MAFPDGGFLTFTEATMTVAAPLLVAHVMSFTAPAMMASRRPPNARIFPAWVFIAFYTIFYIVEAVLVTTTVGDPALLADNCIMATEAFWVIFMIRTGLAKYWRAATLLPVTLEVTYYICLILTTGAVAILAWVISGMTGSVAAGFLGASDATFALFLVVVVARGTLQGRFTEKRTRGDCP